MHCIWLNDLRLGHRTSPNITSNICDRIDKNRIRWTYEMWLIFFKHLACPTTHGPALNSQPFLQLVLYHPREGVIWVAFCLNLTPVLHPTECRVKHKSLYGGYYSNNCVLYRCHRADLAGVGASCGKIRRNARSCLAQGRIDVYTRREPGCVFQPDVTSGVLCCKRHDKKESAYG